MLISSVLTVTVPVADQDRALDFSTGVPDFEVLAARPRAHEIACEGPSDEVWGCQSLFQDPFGNGYVVSQA